MTRRKSSIEDSASQTSEDEAEPQRKRKQKAKRPLHRRILRGVLITLAVPVVLVLLLVGFLHTGSGQNMLRERLVERLSPRIDGTLTLESFEFSVFGSVALGDLTISDPAGDEIIKLSSLELHPDWDALMDGKLVLDEVVLTGLSIDIEQTEDGSSNLKKAFAKWPPLKKKPNVTVHDLNISKVAVTIHKPDGTSIAVSDVEVRAALNLAIEDKRFLVEVSRIAANVVIDKPEANLTVSVTDFSTGAFADLDKGAGKIALRPTKAHVSLKTGSSPAREIDLSLDGIEATMGNGELDAALSELLIGALVLSSLDVQGRLADGALSGDQNVDLVGLHLDHGRLNELLQKDVLATDVDLKTRLSGPPGKLVLDTELDTEGGHIAIKGSADVTDRDKPAFDVTLVATELDTEKLLASAVPISKPIKNERIELKLKGEGKTKEAIVADVNLEVTNTSIGKILVDRVTLDAHVEKGVVEIKSLVIEAFDQRVLLAGKYRLADKHIELDVTPDADVGAALAKVRLAGIPVTSSLPEGAIRLPEGALRITAEGQLDGALTVHVLAPRIALAGGALEIDARADLLRHPTPEPGQKKVELKQLDAHIRLHGIDAGAVAALRGKSIKGFDAKVSGQIDVEGTVEKPKARFGLQVRARAKGDDEPHPEIVLQVNGHGDKQRLIANVTASSKPEVGDPTTLAEVSANLPLTVTDERKGLALYAPMHVTVDLPRRTLGEITPLLPRQMLAGKKLPANAAVSLHADIRGTAARPLGEFQIDAEAEALAGLTQRLRVDGEIHPDGAKSVIEAETRVWLDSNDDETAKADIEVALSRSPLTPGHKDIAWKLGLGVAPQKLSELPITSDKLADLDGTVSARFDLSGSRSDVLGKISIDAADITKGDMGPLGAHIELELEPERTKVDISAALAGSELLAVRGHAGVPGKGLIPAIKQKKLASAPLDIELSIPRRAMKSLAAIRPKLKDIPGELAGKIAVTGTVGDPRVDGDLGVDGFETLSGESGRVGLDVHAGEKDVELSIGLGPRGDAGAASPVAIRVHTQRADIAAFRKGGELPVIFEMKASQVDLKRLVPAFALKDKRDALAGGTLSWDMQGRAVLAKTDAGTKLVDGGARGRLSLADGKLAILGTPRTIDDVQLDIRVDDQAIHIARLSLSESDRQRSNRKLDVGGKIAWSKLRPKTLDLSLKSDEFLVHGGKLGMADAPRGQLTIDASIKGFLDRDVKRIDVTVNDLELLIPDRFVRAHQPEETDEGDVLVVGDGVEVGKLPVPDAVAEAAKAGPSMPPDAVHDIDPDKMNLAPGESPIGKSIPDEETGTDIYVHIPKKVHILQSPIEMWPVGTISVKIRPTGRTIEGRLVLVDGELSLGGKMHRLQKGSLYFDAECPTGCVSLHFAKKMPQSLLRDVSLASGSDSIHIKMRGPLSDRQTTLSGAASPGTLFDLLSAHNAGRARYLTQPDMPASATVEYPQHNNLLLLSYLSVNLPHMLFMDRIAAWADPYDHRAAYGQIEHVEAERYAKDGTTRVRTVQRPRGAGQSQAELQLDWLWNHPQSRAMFGAGLTAGSRAGGGPGLFFEWSSED